MAAPNLKKVRQKLEALRIELTDVAEAAREGRQPVELDQTKVGRLSRMDALQDQAMQVEVENRRRVELQRIDAALARIEDGEYGYCVRCGDEIEGKRLALDPAVPFCQDCAQSGNSGSGHRP